MGQREGCAHTEDRVIRTLIRASQERERWAQDQGWRKLEPGAHADHQITVGVGDRVAIQLGRRAGVTPGGRAKGKNAYGLRHRYRGTDGSSQRKNLGREVHGIAADILARTKTERQRAARADLPGAFLLQRHRVAEAAVQGDGIAVEIAVARNTD